MWRQVILKDALIRGVLGFEKKGMLILGFIGPFNILEIIGSVVWCSTIGRGG